MSADSRAAKQVRWEVFESTPPRADINWYSSRGEEMPVRLSTDLPCYGHTRSLRIALNIWWQGIIQIGWSCLQVIGPALKREMHDDACIVMQETSDA